MTQTSDEAIVREIITEFTTFKNTYDQYQRRMDDLLCSLSDREGDLLKVSEFLLFGADPVTFFTIGGSRAVGRLEGLLKKGGA
ncbi:hypothetical protein [Rhizobium sp. IMFF44]|uniref:hypothetical protein n=1 Tax=Rhizobium sp. IMFF44 TaxID=3342350 RepID=UPI0035B72E7E